MNRKAAAAALAAYAEQSGPGEQAEPEHWQASDLITDLLLMFDDETADLVRHRVERDYDAERSSVQPCYPPAN